MGMELKIENFDIYLQSECHKIIKHCAEFEKQLRYYSTSEKGKSDRILILLLHAVQRIAKVIFPAIGAGEFFDLPKEATDAADNPEVIIVDRENPDWDFRPWFFEKFNMVKRASEELLEVYETDAQSLTLAPNSGMTPIQFLTEKMQFQLKTIRSYSEAILQMLESGRLSVRDVRIEES